MIEPPKKALLQLLTVVQWQSILSNNRALWGVSPVNLYNRIEQIVYNTSI